MQTSLRSNYHNYYNTYGNTHDQNHDELQQQQQNQLLQYNHLDNTCNQSHHHHQINEEILLQTSNHHENSYSNYSSVQHHHEQASYQTTTTTTLYYEPISTQFNHQNNEDYELVTPATFTSCDQQQQLINQQQLNIDVLNNNFNSQQLPIGLECSYQPSTAQHYDNTDQCFSNTTALCTNEHQQLTGLSYDIQQQQQPSYHGQLQQDLCSVDQQSSSSSSSVVYHNLEQINSNINNLEINQSGTVSLEENKQTLTDGDMISLHNHNQYIQHNDEISNSHCSLDNNNNADGRQQEDDDDDDDDDDDNDSMSNESEAGCSSPFSEGSSSNSTLTRDEKRAREANIPLTYYEIVNLSIDQFNDQLAKHKLSEGQLTLIKDIRRRGKNKVAAQSCRKRKMEQIYELQHEVEQLANKRRSLSCQKDQLQKEHANLIQKYDKIYNLISLFRGNVTN